MGFTVDEGPRYVLTSIDVQDELASLAPELDRSLVAKPFDPLGLRALRLVLRELLRDLGYPDPRIRLEIVVNRETKGVAANFEGEAGHRARVVEVHVAGQERTAESVIRSKIEIRKGEWFNGSDVEKSLSNLYLSGLFSRVDVEREERGPGEVALTIRVEEVDAQEIAFLVGYGSYEKVRGAVIYTDRNLFGWGQSLRVAGRVSTKSYGADATWTEPEIFGSKTAFSVTTFAKQREEPAFDDFSWGASAAFSRRLFEHTQGRLGYSFQDRDASEVDPSLALINNDLAISTLFSELSRDTRDSQLYPGRGHRELVHFEVASDELGGEIDFVRLTARADWHYTFVDDWIFSLAAQSGWIWPGGNQALPVQERFYNGGESSVRSFREAELGPLTARGVPEGGEYRNIFNAEFRFPVFHAFKGAVFADAGNVGSQVENYGLSDMRYAIGAGLRLALPIGPIRLDYGWNPDQRLGEREYTLHLAVGLPF